MPQNLKKLLGIRYIFQLRLNEFNVKEGFEHYTVAKIFDAPLHDSKICYNKILHKPIDYFILITTNTT